MRVAPSPWAALLLAALLAAAACTPGVEVSTPEPDPLIPLARLLATPSYDAPQLSPDGTKVAYLAPLDGVANLFVAPTEDLQAARPLTRKTGRGVQPRDVSGNLLYRFTLDSRRLLYLQDRHGDENWNLFSIDLLTGEERDLTRLEGARVELLGLHASIPSQALVGISASLLEPLDLYRLDLDTGERELIQASDGFLGFVADHELRPRIAMALDPQGGFALSRSGKAGEWQPLFTFGPDDFPAIQATSYQKIARFDPDNRKFFFYDSRGRDTIALVGYDLEDDALEVIAADDKVDIASVLFHPREDRPQAYTTNWTRQQWHVLDPAIAPDLDLLAASTEGDIDVVSRSAEDERWIVRFTLAHEPDSYQLYDRSTRKLSQLFVTTPQLLGLRLSRMFPVVIPSRDGLNLVSYLSFPPWLETDAGRPKQPVPLVLLVHGGPSDERAQYAYGPFVHWLTNRGYGVFYVNYRGSPGFGKAFVNAQRLEWGGKMHDDLVDQVEWAIREGITTREQVAILGGSYGGYATLVAMTMTPEVFACGVDLVGPSNLEIFMPHWNEDLMGRVVGNPRTEEGRALLRARSPINFAHQAKHPILIGQGANDSRVPQDQSDSMVKVFEKNGVAVTYVLYPDEGHGLLRSENQRSFWAITEVFLGQCLGGRYEALTDQLEGSSAEVRAGAEHIPGLPEALARRTRTQ